MKDLSLKINGVSLEKVCIDCEWHRATAIDTLRDAARISQDDAEAYISYAFAEKASTGGNDPEPMNCLTEEQWDALQI